jgi:hypothetical protein
MVWNKGLKFPGRVNAGSFKKGEHRSRSTEFTSESLSREKHPRWKGGRYKNTAGYVFVLQPDHPYANCDGYVREHRLVIEKNIGRYLEANEKVHHINGEVSDNRAENLVLCKNNSEHFKTFHTGTSWARKYACCISCGTTRKKHEAFGLCFCCYKRMKARCR